jgi:hypothetical protein
MKRAWLAGWLGVAAAVRADGAPPRGASREAVREAVREVMRGHGADMERLLWSVVFARTRDAGVLARGMRGARRLDEEDGVAADYVARQDDLAQAASSLSRASERGDEGEVARAFGEVVRACVSCHARWLP